MGEKLTATGSRRGPYRRGVATRLEIVHAGAAVFGELGFTAGTLRQIADLIGLSPAALLRHFGTKEGLLLAVLGHWMEQIAKLDCLKADGVEFFHRLPELVRFHVNQSGLIGLFLTIATEAAAPEHPAYDLIQSHQKATIELFSGKLEDAIQRGELPRMPIERQQSEIRRLVAMMDGLELQWMLNPSLDVEAEFGAGVAVILAHWSRGAA